jgi:transposase InsO family protein
MRNWKWLGSHAIQTRTLGCSSGSQYASGNYAQVLEKHGITPSISRKGNCWDNACSETLFSCSRLGKAKVDGFGQVE